MKKNIKIMMASVLSFLFVSVPNVFAETKLTDVAALEIDGKVVVKYYDNVAVQPDDIPEGNDPYASGNGADYMIANISIDDKKYAGYCVEIGVPLPETLEGKTTEDPINLYQYFRNALSESETDALMEKISLYVKYGYQSEGRDSKKYLLATQQLIWQAISDTGFYESEYYYERAGAKFKIENFKWTFEDKTEINVSNELAAIKASANSYYDTPSFCSSKEKFEIAVNEKATFTDNNKVLSAYEVKCEGGITCKKDGNKLEVTATDKEGTQKITFSKSESGNEVYLYKVGNRQGLIYDQGTLEAVSCEFGVDTYKNQQTAGMKIAYIVVIGLFCGTMAYITYYTKKSLNELK